MDTRSDDLNDLERRLAALSPAGDGLAADRMLFAAGKACVRPGSRQFTWMALSASLALLAGGLGIWGLNERTERLALAARLEPTRQQPAQPLNTSQEPILESASPDRLDETSFLASHQILRSGLEGLPAALTSPRAEATEAPEYPVLRARPSGEWPGL
jgi:hypothetical protein